MYDFIGELTGIGNDLFMKCLHNSITVSIICRYSDADIQACSYLPAESLNSTAGKHGRPMLPYVVNRGSII